MHSGVITSAYRADEPVAFEDLKASPLFAYDEPDSWAVFSECVDSSQTLEASPIVQSFVVVTGMHCSACALKLEAALAGVKGVMAVRVSASSKRASVTWSPALTRPSIWMSAGLVHGLQLAPAEDAGHIVCERQQSRLVLWRWLVAGFCMMQVMMYATPGYFAQPGDMTPDIEKLLRWASWLLSLPVVLFSCGPFFANAWRDMMQRSISMDLPVALGIAVTFAVSTAATFERQGWWGHEVYFDSLTMFVFFLLTGRWLEQRMRSRTAGALGALMQRLPISIQRQTDSGEFERVAVRRLSLGNVVQVSPGEAFPADGTVVAGSALADEALLTGESTPVARDAGAFVMAGSYNVGNSVLVRIDRLGAATRYAQIVTLMAKASLDKPRLAILADKVAKPFLLFVLFAATGAAAYQWQTDPALALMAAVAVLVVTCPCALSLATPSAMLTTAGLLARNGVLVRRLQAIESLSDIDTVIFDKTGTLTDSAMSLKSVLTRSGISRQQAMQRAASLARHSLHPVSRALVAAAEAFPSVAVSSVKELAGQGLEGWFDESCGDFAGPLRLGSGMHCAVGPIDAANDAASAGMRVFLADKNGWMATFDLNETLKPDAFKTVAGLRAQGLSVYMLSGDTAAAAERVANQLDIQHATGACTPGTKLELMMALQAKGHRVLMIGDGLNDGPVLAAANVSVCVGAAVPLAQAQSDFVISGANLSILPSMVGQARRTMSVVRQNLWWAAIYNAVCVPLAFSGHLSAWLAGLGMAVSSLLVISNAARLAQFPKSA